MPASTADAPLDLVVVADPRQRSAEARCLATLLATAGKHGYATALLPVLAPAANPARPFHPAVARPIERGAVALLDPDLPRAARLTLVYHLPPLLQPAGRRVRLRSDEVLARGLKVMDATALTLCRENGTPIHVFNMDDEANIDRIVSGERVGTLVETA